jgi:tol-pal system protein YbgF
MPETKVAVKAGLLLSVWLLAGCAKNGIIMPWTRDHQALSRKLDSLYIRVGQLDSARQASDVALRAALSNDADGLKAQIATLSAQLDDFGSRLGRITQRSYQPRETVATQSRTPAGVNPTALYDQAYGDYTRGKFDIARQGFTEYLKSFPGSDLADNAQYWLAECFYSVEQYPAALAEFQRVSDQYPNSDKLTAAIYKAGKCFEALGEKDKAVVQYELLVQKYPNSPEARLAAENLKQLQH